MPDTQQFFSAFFKITDQAKNFDPSWNGAQNLGDTKKRIEILESQVSADWDAPPSSSSTTGSSADPASSSSSSNLPKDNPNQEFEVMRFEMGSEKSLNNTVATISQGL
jgi:hypothetical protein